MHRRDPREDQPQWATVKAPNEMLWTLAFALETGEQLIKHRTACVLGVQRRCVRHLKDTNGVQFLA